jgi:hypothetical protein
MAMAMAAANQGSGGITPAMVAAARALADAGFGNLGDFDQTQRTGPSDPRAGDHGNELRLRYTPPLH